MWMNVVEYTGDGWLMDDGDDDNNNAEQERIYIFLDPEEISESWVWQHRVCFLVVGLQLEGDRLRL